MQDWLLARKNTSPDKIALVAGAEAVTYERLHWLTHEISVTLQSHIFIRPGDHVAVLLPTSLRYAAALFALMRAKAVIVPLNTRLTVEELRWQLENADCTVLIYDRETEAQAVQLANSRCRGILLEESTHEEVDSLTFVRAHVSPDDEHLAGEIDLKASFGIIYTSGTSGKPKGAVLTYGNLFYSALASAYHIGHLPDDKWLCVLPLYHVGGLSILIRAVLYGITVDLRRRFDAEEINYALTHDSVTLVSLVPTMLYRLLDTRRESWSSRLRLVLVGGAAASVDLIERCGEAGIAVATTYGLSEAASQVATAPPEVALRKPGSAGRPLLFTQVRIVDEDGQVQPAGEYGEVLVQGPTVMQGYYNNPSATASALGDGWLHTGDLGYLDEDGDLWIVQRRSDLIISGGENVYPAEVEAVLRAHPAVKEAVAVGVVDAEWGQKVAAVVQLQSGCVLTEAELLAYSRAHLAGYKQPRLIRFIDELPQTASGKIERKTVQALFGGI